VLIGHEENDQGWNRNVGWWRRYGLYIYKSFWNLHLTSLLHFLKYPFSSNENTEKNVCCYVIHILSCAVNILGERRVSI
jgi:hypothetical protein